MQIDLRKTEPADAQALGYVHYTAWMETYPGLLPSHVLEASSLESSVTSFERNRCQNTVAAFADGRIAGFCGYGRSRDADAARATGEIQGIYVLRRFQRISVGQKLLVSALRELYMKRWDFSLTGRRRCLPGMGLYRKNGTVLYCK